MRDDDVTQFLESGGASYTMDDIKEYVEKVYKSPNDFLFGIFLIETNEHIGNIKIGNINQKHNFAEVGVIIGDKRMWGKGYASESIKLVSKFAFDELNLNKLTAGMYEPNIGSYKAFLNAGFVEVGRYKKHRIFKDKYVDEILLEKNVD